jgi:hypothetical protein
MQKAYQAFSYRMSELLRGSCTRVSNFRPKKIISRKTKQDERDGHFVGIPPLSRNGKNTELDFVSLGVGFLLHEIKNIFLVHEKFYCRCCPSV